MKNIITLILLALSINLMSQKLIECGAWTQQERTDTLNANFDSLFKKTSNWVTPSIFNAPTDSVTDALTALNAMFDYCRTNNVDAVFEGGYYKITGTLLVDNVTIRGEATIEGTNNNIIMGAYGSVGVYRNILSNAVRGERYINITDTDFLDSLNRGDLVKIRTDRLAGDNIRFGEIHKVDSISSTGVYFDDVLFADYLTSENAEISIVYPVKFNIVGDFTLKYPEHLDGVSNNFKSIGILAMYTENSNIVGVNTFSCAAIGVSVNNCYKPYIRTRTSVGFVPSIGYGVSVNGASMYADVSGAFTGHKHCFETGGDLLGGGIPWEVNIHDSRGATKYQLGGATFDSHPSTGSIKFSNCVSYGDGGAGSNGFNLDAIYTTVDNCETYNTHFTYTRASNYSYGTLNVFNSYADNYNFGLSLLGGANSGKINVDGFYATDGKDGSIAFYLIGDTIASLNINNVDVECSQGVGLLAQVLDDKFICNNITITNKEATTSSNAISISSPINKCVFNNIFAKRVNYLMSAGNDVDNVILNNITIDSLYGDRVLSFSDTVNNLRISNLSLDNILASNTSIARIVGGINKFEIFNTNIPDNVAYSTNIPAGGVFDEYYRSGVFGEFTNENLTTEPDIYRNYDADARVLSSNVDSANINTDVNYIMTYSGSIDENGGSQDTCVIRIYTKTNLSSAGAGNNSSGSYSLVVNRGNNASFYAKSDNSFIAHAFSYTGLGNHSSLLKSSFGVTQPTFINAPVVSSTNDYYELMWVNSYAPYNVKPIFVFYNLSNVSAITITKK